MLGQSYAGRLSDRYSRSRFVFLGGIMYGFVALTVPFASDIGDFMSLPDALFGLDIVPSLFVVIVLNALLGVADSLREPASMALFADEGIGVGITSSFGIRNLVWLPGSIIAPMIGGFLMTDI